MHSNTLRNLAVSIATLGMGGLYLYETYRLPGLVNVDPLGPKAFPALIGLLILACGIGIAIETIVSRQNEDETGAGLRDSRLGAVTATAGWLFVYAYVLEPVGYLLSTIVFLAGLMFFLRATRPVYILLVALCFPVLMAALLSVLLGYQPAPGVLGF